MKISKRQKRGLALGREARAQERVRKINRIAGGTALAVVLPAFLGDELRGKPGKDPLYVIFEHTGPMQVKVWFPDELGWVAEGKHPRTVAEYEAILDKLERELDVKFNNVTLPEDVIREAK